MKNEARAILRRFEQGRAVVSEDGDYSAASWHRLSPPLVIAQAYCLWVLESVDWQPDEVDRVEEVVRGLFSDPGVARFMGTVDDAVLVTRGVLGDHDAAAEADAREAGTLHNLTALLDAARLRGQLSEPDLDALLEWAVTEVEETLGSGELTRPQIRDGQVGPWDATEVESEDSTASGDRIDLGALRVPVVAGMRIRPEGIDLQAGEGNAYGVTLNVGGASLQLQVFSAPEGGLWGQARHELVAKIAAAGGEAQEGTGRLGMEIRGTVPGGESGADPVGVRFIGCDGPGWMLRGVLTGLGADSDIIQEQARRIFVGAVVDIRTATPLPNGCVPLHWPPLSGWDDDTTPLFD
ncbi:MULTISPECIES: DUF3710 domain-containing protein [Streptomyces]|uniref:DUF3710 domain-containing protein n=1 Tax=Streptomyces TaxID=1883 RepID=UPI003328C2E0